MTAQRAEGRRVRGRVVLVGPSPARLAEPFERPVLHAPSLYDALGEVTAATAAEPVAAVLVPRDVAAGATGRPAEVFHRVDPSVRVFLVTRPGLAPPPTDGYDGVLVEPVDPARLEEALEDRTSGRVGEADPSRSGPRVRPDTGQPVGPCHPEASDARVAWVSEADPCGPQGGSGPATFSQPRAVAPPPPPAPAPLPLPRSEPLASEPLGDTDLVEAVLTDPEGTRLRALRVIAQQTGWSDLRLAAAEGAAGEPPRGAAEVRYGRRSFGALCSGQATESQLRPWAEWLARWLALDQSYREFRQMAFHDELTSAGNRRFYDLFMRRVLPEAARRRRPVTVMVFDIDDFKSYNDRFGHEAGDEILRETVRLLNSVIRTGDRVCRIGGDEFVVVFADMEGPREPGSHHPQSVELIAGRFQDQICRMKFPKLGLEAPGTLSISGGLATYPWDGRTPEELLRHADALALQSKKTGKNVITMGKRG